MRVWDIHPSRLCRAHLLGEHREIHAIWSIIVNCRKGYAHHPETMRWRGRLRALHARHGKIAAEMKKRGYRHRSPLDRKYAKGTCRQTEHVHTIQQQRDALRRKGCDCRA